MLSPLLSAAFQDVDYEGRTLASSQSNNMYFFPGLALGAQLGHTKIVSDNMLMEAAEAIPAQLTEEDIAAGRIYPKLENIRTISKNIAVEVMKVRSGRKRRWREPGLLWLVAGTLGADPAVPWPGRLRTGMGICLERPSGVWTG